MGLDLVGDRGAVVGPARHGPLPCRPCGETSVRPGGQVAGGVPLLVDPGTPTAVRSPRPPGFTGGLIFPHPQGIVIGGGTVVGPRAWIYQNATIGGAPGKPGLPHVGADARIYAGAVLTGPILVGDNVLIGANAVVHRDVPSRTAVRSAAVESGPLPGFAVSEGR